MHLNDKKSSNKQSLLIVTDPGLDVSDTFYHQTYSDKPKVWKF